MASIIKRNGIHYIQFKDLDGKWKMKTCRGMTSDQIAEELHEKEGLELNMRHKKPIYVAKTTLIEQLKQFRDVELGRPRGNKITCPSTVKRYKGVVDGIKIYLDDNNITLYEEFTPKAVQLFWEHLIFKRKLSASCLEKYRQIMNQFLNWSVKQHFITENPFDEIPNPKRKKGIPYYFSTEQLEKIFAAANPLYRTVFKFMYLTGMRSGEVANAQWEHFDTSSSLLLIPAIPGNKTKTEGTIPIEGDALKILKEQKEKNMEVNTPEAKQYIFINKNGLNLDAGNIYRHFQVVKKNCELPKKAVPHTFRHTCASHLVNKGIPLQVVQKLLRHASIRETEIYAHLAQEPVRSAVKLLKAPKPKSTMKLLATPKPVDNLSESEPKLLAAANARQAS